MSPPEVWGPAVWILFHTLSERINNNAFQKMLPSLFQNIVRICKFLPCPECSVDASNFLAKIKLTDLKNKSDLKNMFYFFHNWVNAKKKKKLCNFSFLTVYGRYNLINVVNNFIMKYQTKGNMKLLNESFQRQLIIKDFKNWFTNSFNAFNTIVNIPPQILSLKNNEIVQSEENVQPEEIKSEENVQPEEIKSEENVQPEEIKSEENVQPEEIKSKENVQIERNINI
jgi:hypothetical protein